MSISVKHDIAVVASSSSSAYASASASAYASACLDSQILSV